MLADAEIGLFSGVPEEHEQLLRTAWYLHSIACTRPELDLYDLPRRRTAHQVAAHIFDLHLQSQVQVQTIEDDVELLRYVFATEVSYIGSELIPNAAAVRRRWAGDLADPTVSPGAASLQAGILLLGFDRPGLFDAVRRWRAIFGTFAVDPPAIERTSLASCYQVIEAVASLLIFLVYGTAARLDDARNRLVAALFSDCAMADVDSRWVAAQLLNLAEQLRTASVWTALPPGSLPAVGRAMTLGDPPVLVLWPPQLSFLGGQNGISPLEDQARRLVLSFPTSAGKTLLAQLMILCHITAGQGDACVVAPTHSLCREIQRALDARLTVLGRRSFDAGPIGSGLDVPSTAGVVVMTPERLSAALHVDPQQVLNRFSLFVIDEAHLVADVDRGWKAEEVLSLLNLLTRDSDHRVALLSAAMGNQVHLKAWLDTGAGFIESHEEWRGPRRLHAIYSALPDFSTVTTTQKAGQRIPREQADIKGKIYLRTVEGNHVAREFSEPVGTLVRHRNSNTGEWVDDKETTPQRTRLVPLIEWVARTGPVLVVQATKSGTTALALELAGQFQEDPSNLGLVELSRTRLGDEHPLTRVLRHGVAFHHGALPSDIQAEIEQAVRDQRIRVLVGTTTLTEGVNLPFKTVIVGSRGYSSDGVWIELINDADLINAVGRAGRAGRETEGWLILADHRKFNDSRFEPLELTSDDVKVRSTLAVETALEGLASIERSLAHGEDAIFESASRETNDFVSYVWFIAEALGQSKAELSFADILQAVQSTLAWQQWSDEDRERWVGLAAASFSAYGRRAPSVRRRWARAGTSLGTARELDAMVDEVVEELGENPPANLDEAIERILGGGRLSRILSLPESPDRGFKTRANAPAAERLDVDLIGMLRSWVSGDELETIATTFLAEVTDPDYLSQQLSQFMTEVFEHFLPWTLRIVIAWTNARLESEDRGFTIPESVPANIHYGVPNGTALALMWGGIRSRRLAVQVAQLYRESSTEMDVRDWLTEVGLPYWRQELDASATELSDLLTFVRDPRASIVASVLNGGVAEIPISLEQPIGDDERGKVRLVKGSETPPQPSVEIGGTTIAQVRASSHNDAVTLISLGLPLTAWLAPESDSTLYVRLSADAMV
jgi:hypothetical protein